MMTKTTNGVMIFTVNIIRHRTTHRRHLGTWRAGKKPAIWYGQGQELGKRHPGFTAEDAALGVKLNKTVKATG
jgi:hypothetical protein